MARVADGGRAGTASTTSPPPGWSDELDRAVSLIGAAPSIGLVCHACPDGDALGSMLALLHLALVHGVQVTASWPEPFVVAPHYDFLPGLELATKPADFEEHRGPVVTFDCGSLDRLGELAPAAAAAAAEDRLIVLDHHITNDRYGTVNVIDPSAAATAVVVRRLLERLGWALNRDAALCLYTGLVTDTGRFQYSNTTADVFSLAEELSAFDLPISEITRELFEKHRFAYLQLTGAALSRAQLDPELRFVATWVSADEFERHGVRLEESEGLIDLVRRASEAEVACVAREAPEGIKVSLRSVSSVDVSVIARSFGGGGHRYAAGFTHPGPVERTLAEIRRAVAGVLG